MTTATLTSYYGMRELKGLYQRYTSVALGTAIFLHALVIGGYYVVQIISEDDDAIPMVRIMKYSDLGPPPSITNSEVAPQVAVTVPVAKLTVGVPVPVPDAEVSPEQTIPTQQELSAVSSPVTGTGEGAAGTQITQDINIDEDPADFVPVEKQPVIVKMVTPEYPEFAKRIGAEGVVWVKILVDKEGKAKKALILKSENDVFNESAQKAAMQYVFTPAVMNNGPVAVWVSQPFRFKLTK